MTPTDVNAPVTYKRLLSGNKAVRYVWLSQIFGQTGDWLNLIALFALVGSGSNPATAIAFVLSLHYLCPFLLGPFAGMAADRFDRRTILIVSDAIRIPIALAFIWFGHSPIAVYLLAGLQYSAGAFFEPTRTALTQELAEGRELLAANSLGMATYGASGFVGMFAGGLLITAFGTTVCFVVNALTFAISIFFLLRLGNYKPKARSDSEGQILTWTDLFRLLGTNKRLAAAFLVKLSVGLLGGGYWVIVIRYAQGGVFTIGEGGNISNGIVNGTMFIGVFVASILVNHFMADERKMPRNILGFLTARILLMLVLFGAPFLLQYGGAGTVGSFAIVLAAVLGQSVAGAGAYILSTQLIKDLAPAAFHGRIFAIDLGLMNLGFGASAIITGMLIDDGRFTLVDSNLYIAAVMTPLAVVWLMIMISWDHWTQQTASVAP